MAKSRIINTRFWVDDYISNLDPVEKLLFLYFLTNPSTDICGVYEIPLKTVAVDTGLDIEMVKKIIKRFSREGKIFYQNGWVGIKNFIKHQSVNPKVEKGIKNGLDKAPKEMLDRLSIDYTYPTDSLSHSNLNSNLNSNSNFNAVETSSTRKNGFNPLGSEIVKAFEVVDSKNKTYYANKTQRSACDFLLSEFTLEVILDRIKVLPHTNKLPYFPKINSPYDLKEKWVKLEDQMKSKKVEYEQSINKNKIAF
jgi:hypothetical protein